MLISVHVPKCAGTSFRHVLDGICGDHIWYNYGTIFSREQARLELVPDGTRVIHGHFIADSFDDILPERQLITWVRDPIERLVSNYQYFLRSPDMRDDCCRAVHENKLGLREFVDLDWMRNMTSRYLANKTLDEFKFVGICEAFEASMGLFETTFGYRTSGNMPRVNTNPDRAEPRYGITHGDREYILQRNAADMEWYGNAVDRFAESTGVRISRVA
ncbi:MAG TPA: sulfotransferase family 2 domain-containing protein [Opitutaceae bacterium]|nr:sulfotransferase family 2 domain-containing protein [Opitutaceae bacterium]